MKCRWYTFQCGPTEIDALREHILGNQYSDEKESGYIPLELKRHSLCAQFVERLTIAYDTYDLGSGAAKIEEQVQNVTRFVLSRTHLPLEVVPGPYGGTSLLRNLAKVRNAKLCIAPIGIDILGLLKAMQRKRLDPSLKELRISGVTLSTATQASITIRGGKVLRAMREMIGGRPARVTSCKLVELSGIQCICSVSSFGRCTIEADSAERVLDTVRSIVAEMEEEASRTRQIQRTR